MERTTPEKRCGRCKLVKPAAAFYRCRRSASGLQSGCIECRRTIKQDPAVAAEQKRLRSGNGPYRFNHARAVAQQRGRTWTIERDYFYELVSRPCEYCGFPVSRCGTGLDRVDSSGGYTADNVVPCCGECNTAKSDNFSFVEMKVIGQAIRQVKLRRPADG